MEIFFQCIIIKTRFNKVSHDNYITQPDQGISL